MQQSYEHLKSMLWGSAQARVCAFVQGSVVPRLREQLGSAEVSDWDCLWRGALTPADQLRAPYVVELLRVSAFTDWLLDEVAGTYPGWGVLGVTQEPLLKARELGRSLMEVRLPGGDVSNWNWLDPSLWGELLPQLDSAQLEDAFGCMSDWVLVAPDQWQWHTLSAGRLQSSVRQRLPAAGA
jgi:hypothetical protein